MGRKRRDRVGHKVRASILQGVAEQLAANNPPEVRETYERLMSEEISEENARIYIGQALLLEFWDIARNSKPYDHDRYVRNLKALPAEPTEERTDG